MSTKWSRKPNTWQLSANEGLGVVAIHVNTGGDDRLNLGISASILSNMFLLAAWKKLFGVKVRRSVLRAPVDVGWRGEFGRLS